MIQLSQKSPNKCTKERPIDFGHSIILSSLLSLYLFLFFTVSAYGEQVFGNVERFFSLLEKETEFFYTMKDYKAIRDILYDELDSHPALALPILHYFMEHTPVYNYSVSTGPLTVIFDNSLKWPVDAMINDDTTFRLDGFSAKTMELPPGWHHLTFFSNEIHYLKEMKLPVVSPPSKDTYLILNIGEKNSYSIRHFDKTTSLRTRADPVKGWPILIRKPQALWITCSEIFPVLDRRRPMVPLDPSHWKRSVKSLLRIQQKKQPTKDSNY